MNKLYNDAAVQAIANAIRAKNGSSDTYTIAEMSTALNDLSYYAKPTIENVPLATFEADGLPLNSLKVSVEAKQAGSGTPSPTNVRPISGWSAANVNVVGKNIAFFGTNGNSNHITDTSNDGNNLQFSADGTYSRIRYRFNVITGKTYTISFKGSGDGNFNRVNMGSIDGWDSNSYGYFNLTSTETTYTKTFTAESNLLCVTFYNTTGSSTGTMTINEFMVEQNDQATTYEPYNGKTVTIQFGQTVYGGELDVVNGELKVTHGYIASYNGETLPSTWISSMDVYAEGTTPTTGAEVCYELATPTTVSITPSLIKSLNGTNNLSVDCGDVIELEYFKEV